MPWDSVIDFEVTLSYFTNIKWTEVEFIGEEKGNFGGHITKSGHIFDTYGGTYSYSSLWDISYFFPYLLFIGSRHLHSFPAAQGYLGDDPQDRAFCSVSLCEGYLNVEGDSSSY